MTARTATVMAGIPLTNNALYHQVRFLVGDPAAIIVLPVDGAADETVFMVRDIEMDRAKRRARADRVVCPADFAPEQGLSGDRETATAQALAELLCRHGVERVVADRSLPLLFSDEFQRRDLQVVCDRELGVLERRSKDTQEIQWLREAQQVTESAVEHACRLIATADVAADGTLHRDQHPLTSEIVQREIDRWLLDRGYDNPTSIVAGGPQSADCHDVGSGPLKTEQPIIVDVFPRNRKTRYYGDCTRSVVHGGIPDALARMHTAVVDAKRAAAAACRAGATGEQVHEATLAVIRRHGYATGMPPEGSPSSHCAMVHGTGHGVGLDVHEPPLLDTGGPELVAGDAITIEPGLYCRDVGGIRVEDMVIVTEDGCENLNSLQEGLQWA